MTTDKPYQKLAAAVFAQAVLDLKNKPQFLEEWQAEIRKIANIEWGTARELVRAEKEIAGLLHACTQITRRLGKENKRRRKYSTWTLTELERTLRLELDRNKSLLRQEMREKKQMERELDCWLDEKIIWAGGTHSRREIHNFYDGQTVRNFRTAQRLMEQRGIWHIWLNISVRKTSGIVSRFAEKTSDFS